MTIAPPQPRCSDGAARPQGTDRGTNRILMTVDAVGGVWRYAMDLAIGLKRHGFSFVFAGLGPSPSAEQKNEAQALGKLVWTDAPLDWMVDGPDALSDTPVLLRELANREAVDLLHLNAPSQAAALVVDCPVLVVSHSCIVTWMRAVRDTEPPSDWAWQKRLNRQGFERADRVVAPSRSHAEALRQGYGPIDNLRIVYNTTVDTDLLDEPRDASIFAAGRWWDEGKNIATLDTAARNLPWPVEVAGALAGPNNQHVAVEHVRHLGILPAAEVRQRAARAGIFVSPSLYEPFGLAVLEAAVAGTPLVLADIPTYRELWSDAALFFSPRDPVALEQALDQLIRDPVARQTMGRKAQARARTYTPDKQQRAMRDLYAALLSQPAPALALTS